MVPRDTNPLVKDLDLDDRAGTITERPQLGPSIVGS